MTKRIDYVRKKNMVLFQEKQDACPLVTFERFSSNATYITESPKMLKNLVTVSNT